MLEMSIANSTQLVKVFPFDDRVVNDLVVLDSTKRDKLTYDLIVRLAERFAPLVDQYVLIEEFAYYQHM